MKNFISLLILISFCTSISAQNLKEMQKKQDLELKLMKDKMLKAMEKQDADYKKYISEEDEKFSDFLEKRWDEFKIVSGEEMPIKPKPKVLPKYIDENINKIEPLEITINPKSIVITNDDPSFMPLKKLPKGKFIISKYVKLNYDFNFFGEDISISTDTAFVEKYKGGLIESDFAKYWKQKAQTDFSQTVNQLIDHSQELVLNDWAYYMLVDEFSHTVFEDDNQSKILISWFIMVQSGYKAKLAFNDTGISLLLPTSQKMFKHSFISIDGEKYYITQKLEGKLFTYDSNFAKSNRDFDLSFEQTINLPKNIELRDLEFTQSDSTFYLKVEYNQNLVDFYKAYPPVSFSNYFNAHVSSLTANSLSTQLKPLLIAKSEEEQAQLLLEFIHQAFPYKTDGEQFGEEKYFFVEDIFAYPYSDCEDRSVLYSYLVRSLLGIKTIGICGPKHLFTAIELKNKKGDSIDFQGSKYTICDPTYIGAPIGKIMPDMENQELEIIPVK